MCNIIEISTNITSDTTFIKDYIYVMTSEIHVLQNITVLIEDNVVIYIRNGVYNTTTARAALIFDTGSKLISSDFYVLACDINNIPVCVPDNGGLWFVGSASDITKDGISAKYSVTKSNFIANNIYTYYLGSTDKDPHWTHESSQDQDSITSLGCNYNEWNILGIYIEYSGDNAFDIVNSVININIIEIIYPGEDAINVQSSKINVKKILKAIVNSTVENDKDIFDLEIDNGLSYILIDRFCFVEISGIFGDQSLLVSEDLPQPNGDNYYYFKGCTNRGQSYIHALED
jgi:hypothetical protein